MKIKFFLGIVLLQFIISCKPEPLTDASFPIDLTDLYYGVNAGNTLDMYLPAKRNGNTRTIILLHGGFWSSGDKSDLTSLAKYLRDQGFACVTMNYRLTNTSSNLHPAQINDIGKVIDFVSTGSYDFHVSSTRFGLMGMAEGAHLALLYTYSANTNEKVKTVVSISGVTDFTDTKDISPQFTPYMNALCGSSQAAIYKQASPADHVSAHCKPTLIIHGKKDNMILYQQSLDFKAKLDNSSVKNDLRLYDNEGHTFTAATITGLQPDISAWFDANLR
jgi:acetyl esterase/lipase